MATLTDFDDTLIGKGQQPSATAHYPLIEENRQALLLGTFGDRRGTAIDKHNHSNRGGRLLTRPLVSVAMGPYTRPNGSTTPELGVPVYPPTGAIDFAAISSPVGKNYKLLVHAGIYLPGGSGGVNVRCLLRNTGAGTRTVKLAFVLRPFSKIAYHYQGVGNFSTAAIRTITTSGGNNFIDDQFGLGALERLGDPTQSKWAEFLIVLVDNPTAATTPRIVGWKIDPVTNSNLYPIADSGLPPAAIDVREYQQAAPILDGLLRRAAAVFEQLVYATFGRVPGKIVDWSQPYPKEDKTSAYRALVEEQNAGTGIHQHQGKRYFDGALIPQQLALLCPVEDMGDNVSSQMNAAPVLGAPVDPTASGSGTIANLRKFKVRVPVAKGDTKLWVCVAVYPGHQDSQGFLYMLVKSGAIFAADYNADVFPPDQGFGHAVDTNTITGVEAGDQYADTTLSGYTQIELIPQDCDVFKPNATRQATGKSGHWTNRALLPASAAPDQSLVATTGMAQTYRISKVVALNIDPQGRTGDVCFEFAFYMTNETGTVKDTARLQWLAVVRPEEP